MAKKATVKPAVLEGDVLDAVGVGVDADEQLALSAGQAIRGFLGGLGGFFTTAKDLEQRALETLTEAKALALPTTAAEDEALQRWIKRTTADKREVEEHWKITATITKFRNLMTSRRAKATDALDQANTIGNSLHTTYVETERRRAREEELRLQREADERARRARDLELARMEEEAVKREEAAAELSGREQVFVEQYAQHGNGLRAAEAAGFRDPLKSSARLLTLAKIQTAVKAIREAKAIRQQKESVARRPLEEFVAPVQPVMPNITRAAGASDRTTHTAELLDEEALIKAILAGSYGIPTDLLQINPVKLNQYARDLEDRINRWPGVRYKRTTKVI